jgi:signal transduction histidine kinase
MNDLSPEECVRRLQRQVDAIHRLTAALYAVTSMEEKERQARAVALETVNADGGTIYLHNPKSRTLVFHYVSTSNQEIQARLQGMEMPDHEGVAGEVFHSGRTLLMLAERDGYCSHVLTVPLRSMQGNTLGVLQVIKDQDRRFDEADTDVLEILAAHIGSVFEMTRLYEQASQAAVIHLIGDISHDIKNFLTPVVTGSQTLEIEIKATLAAVDREAEKMGPDRQAALAGALAGLRGFYKEGLNMIYEGAQDAQERVREIADAIKGVIAAPHFEETQFNEIATAVQQVLKFDAERQGVTIDLSGVRNTPPIMIDRKGLYNAVYNLVHNAIAATPAGGMVSIRSRSLELQGQPGLEVQVADTGMGMPEHVRQRLFTEHAVSTKPGGTGLGTRIVKNVVDAHRGTVQVESEPEQGTTFTLHLPVRQSPGLA